MRVFSHGKRLLQRLIEDRRLQAHGVVALLPADRPPEEPCTRLRCQQRPGWCCAACLLDADRPRIPPEIEAGRGSGEASGTRRIGPRQQPRRLLRQFQALQAGTARPARRPRRPFEIPMRRRRGHRGLREDRRRRRGSWRRPGGMQATGGPHQCVHGLDGRGARQLHRARRGRAHLRDWRRRDRDGSGHPRRAREAQGVEQARPPDRRRLARRDLVGSVSAPPPRAVTVAACQRTWWNRSTRTCSAAC